MKNKLLTISLIISIVGAFVLLLILEYSQLPLFKIKDITDEQLEGKLKIQAKITSIRTTPGLLILNARDSSGVITVIAFNEEKIDLQVNSNVEIEGTIQKYQDKLEIIADKIILLK